MHQLAALLCLLLMLAGRAGQSAELLPTDFSRDRIVYSVTAISPAEGRVRRQLQRPISLDLGSVTLGQLAAHIQAVAGIPVRLNVQTIEDTGASGETPCSPIHVAGISLQSAMKLVLDELEWLCRTIVEFPA
ncbi:MAG: hypothetical protein AB7O62_25145 [Pirellulales bacterium]